MSTARATPCSWPKRSAPEHFHLVSSIASAGLFEGLFREDMFEEAENLDNPYFRTKHDSEGIVRQECSIPWRIYRPALVVGDSRTGEMDKIDGPYYFFKLIQKTAQGCCRRGCRPSASRAGGSTSCRSISSSTRWTTSPTSRARTASASISPTRRPMRVGDLLNTFARAAHAPEMTMRINAALFSFIPTQLRKALLALTPVRRIRTRS